MTKEPCSHDYDHPVRVGRTSYECRICGADISLQIFLLAEAEAYSDEIVEGE